jgi:hypothetical protein
VCVQFVQLMHRENLLMDEMMVSKLLPDDSFGKDFSLSHMISHS